MNVLIIGRGGREHAISFFIAKSPLLKKLYITPGNAGTLSLGDNISLPLHPPWKELIDFIKKNKINFVVIGPENYLLEGLADFLKEQNIHVFGVCKKATLLEGSKSYAKKLMQAYDIPTADYQVFEEIKSARQYLDAQQAPFVLKADGLCAGKGVMILETRKEAKEALKLYFEENKFGEAGKKIVIESFLSGKEASILAFCDGEKFRFLPPSQDHKRIFDQDKGPNTGGMGVYSPLPFLNQNHMSFIKEKIFNPILKAFKENHIDYKGILYAGLMIKEKTVNVVEFNVRFGDPECQCVLPLLETDLLELMTQCCLNEIEKSSFILKEQAALNVVMASGGYPEKYQTGHLITGLENINQKETFVFHAGTKQTSEGTFTAGGRVLSITALGHDIKQASKKAYETIKMLSFKNAHYRNDIGFKQPLK